jgi:hypothetical protein
MHDAGLLTIYSLANVAATGRMPTEKLVKICDAYYDERTVGVTRAYAALGAKQQIDKLVIAYNTTLPANAEYCILEDGNQYRISLKQVQGDDVLLTLERLEDLYDVSPESP